MVIVYNLTILKSEENYVVYINKLLIKLILDFVVTLSQELTGKFPALLKGKKYI